jgi:isopenicillin N synthase-like dioxygenase
MDQLLPQDKLAWDNPRSNRGYIKVGREYVTQYDDGSGTGEVRNKPPNTKESMEIGRDWDKTRRNRWPQESDVPGFKQTMLDFFQVCRKTRYVRFCAHSRS